MRMIATIGRTIATTTPGAIPTTDMTATSGGAAVAGGGFGWLRSSELRILVMAVTGTARMVEYNAA